MTKKLYTCRKGRNFEPPNVEMTDSFLSEQHCRNSRDSVRGHSYCDVINWSNLRRVQMFHRFHKAFCSRNLNQRNYFDLLRLGVEYRRSQVKCDNISRMKTIKIIVYMKKMKPDHRKWILMSQVHLCLKFKGQASFILTTRRCFDTTFIKYVWRDLNPWSVCSQTTLPQLIAHSTL